MLPFARRLAKRININPSRVRLQTFIEQAAASVPDGSRVLDAGAGETFYKHLFDRHRYEAADFLRVDKPYGTQSYVCDLAKLPIESNMYDLVLLTQVMEHLPEPRIVLQELGRVLKPGHQIWLSAPLFFPEHEAPFDFYRYTQFGFRHLLETTGFRVDRIEWLEGYYGTLSFQCLTAAKELPIQPATYGGGAIGAAAAVTSLCLKPTLLVASLLWGRLELRHKHTTSGHCKNYAIVATKR